MAASVENLKSEVPISRRIILWALALPGIFLLTGLLLALNYWVAIIFFFVSLLILIRFGLEAHEWRGMWLLLTICLFVAFIVGSLALLFLSNDPRIPQLAQDNTLANFFLGNNLRIVLTSIFIGLIAPLPLVIVPFFLLVAVTTFAILQWHKLDQKTSPRKVFWYVLFGLLGILKFSVTIEKEEIKGSEADKERLANLGGPGWLTIYPGQVVVLHKWGKITRVTGQGSIMLGREEQIKAIVPLGGKGGPNTIENVLTRDRIPVKITISHAVQVESAQEMRKRLVEEAQKQLQKVTEEGTSQEVQVAQNRLNEAEKGLQNFEKMRSDSDVGDDYDQCDENLAKLVATKVALKENTALADIWESMKGTVAGNLRDVIMSCGFEELFEIEEAGNDLDNNIQSRKISKIEKLIFDKAKGSGLSKGLVLRSVDISEIRFPDQIEEKIKNEMTALAEARINNIEATTREKTSEIKNNIMLKKAVARSTALATEAEGDRTTAIIRAQTEKETEILRGEGRSEYYRQIVQVLREQHQPEETIKIILQHLAASNSILHYVRSEQTINTPAESNGN